MKMIDCNLFGMTCDGRDIIATDFYTPEMMIGDWLVFGGLGAYTVGPKSMFNGMEATTRIVEWSGQMINKESAAVETREEEIGTVVVDNEVLLVNY